MYKNLQINSLENEIWIDLNFDLRYSYQISSCGRVRLLKTNYCCIKKQRVGNHGHPIISIRYSKNSIKRYLVHRLVANSFILNKHNKRTVNHINGIKYDNRVENLEWASDYDQAIHRHYVLNKKTTIRATEIAKLKNKIKVSQFNADNVFIKEFDSLKEAGESIGKRHQAISMACKKKYKQAYGYIWDFSHNLISKINSPINQIRI